jgi:hypothetical protein
MFGEKTEMLKFAYKRAKELGGDASVYGDKFFGGTHIIYVLEEKVALYNALPAKPKVASSIIFWKELVKPSRMLEAGAGWVAIAASVFSRRRGGVNSRRVNDRG